MKDKEYASASLTSFETSLLETAARRLRCELLPG